jgi:hypothetical protein
MARKGFPISIPANGLEASWAFNVRMQVKIRKVLNNLMDLFLNYGSCNQGWNTCFQESGLQVNSFGPIKDRLNKGKLPVSC